MFKPTPSLCSKASRLPLNSKKANRDFYKGTRTGNIMVRKRIATADRKGNQIYDKDGKPQYWTLRTHRIDEARVPSYVVPPGLDQTKLQPYVFMGRPEDGGVSSKGKFGLPSYQKMDKSGLDGTYYRSVIDQILAKRRIREQSDNDKRLATEAGHKS